MYAQNNKTEDQQGNRRLKNVINQPNLTNVYRTIHSTKYTFFPVVHGPFCRIDYMLNHKTDLNEFERTEIIQSIFFDQDGIKSEINSRKKFGNSQMCVTKTTCS